VSERGKIDKEKLRKRYIEGVGKVLKVVGIEEIPARLVGRADKYADRYGYWLTHKEEVLEASIAKEEQLIQRYERLLERHKKRLARLKRMLERLRA